MRQRKLMTDVGILCVMALAGGPALGAVTFLHTQGQDMVDESGKKVLLQGVGLGNWMLPEGYMWRFGGQADRPRRIEKVVSDLLGPEKAARFWAEFRKNYVTEADIARIAELGFNSVRPALNARLFLTEGDKAVFVDEGFQLLDNLVGWCRKHNLYVIIDMHGAPGGQTGQNIDDSANDQPELFTDKKNQDRLVELWVKIAGRYKDEPTVAGYDLLNEPLPGRTGAAGKYKDQLEPLYQRITAAIRQVDARHMITVEGCDWANDWSVFSTPFDKNLFYQFHFYCWDRPAKLNDISRFLSRRQELNAPVWVGETGEKDNAMYWATMQLFETNNIGWSFWPWKKMETTNTPYSIKTPEGWDAVRAYTRNGTKPAAQVAEKAFDQLLDNVKLANCVYFPDVVNAMFRRVPGRVEAENYGHEGFNQSYFVKDATQKSKYYRTSEPVPVEQIAGGNRQDGGQGIRLTAGEWTVYTANSLTARLYPVLLRAKAEGGSAMIRLLTGSQVQDVAITATEWREVPLEAISFKAGVNRFKVLVRSGTASIDWIAFGTMTGAPDAASNGRASVRSPDGTIEMTLRGNGPLTYSVSVDGKVVLADSRLGLKFKDGLTLGANARLVKVESSSVDTSWENALGKRRTVRDHHNELHAYFVESSGRPFEIVVRACDDGIGFRYVLPAAPSAATQDFVLDEEQTQFCFPENYTCYAGENENTGKKDNPIGYVGSQESEYKPMRLGDLPTEQVRMLPLLVQTPAAWVLVTESDLYDWAGMWVNRATTSGSASGVTLAARLSPRPDGQGLVKSTFPRQSPWRTFVIARQPGRLVESDLVLNLATSCVLADTSWIKPGISSWDWWHQVTRPSTATFKELIQFSADMGWSYVLLDAGWSGRNTIVKSSPAVNMEELLAFAKEKNVQLWLWLHWTSVDRNDAYQEAFPLYEKWGIAGVKIDFMNRDDQEMVNWYEKIVKAAAQHHLLVNYHGAFKPTGMIRTYPNQITREGILGNEYNRWSARVTPEHKATLPFTRLVAGPADFTPGGFLNKPLDQFKFNVKPSQVQGTRCAELALFVCLETPVINACDHPSHYQDQPGLDFLKIVPTVWDETRAVDAAVGEHVVIVRRHGSEWFLGALTDRNARDIPVKLDFLGAGSWTVKLWKDAPDSDTVGAHLAVEQRTVTATDSLTLHLARAGGAVACFEPVSVGGTQTK